MESRKKAKPTTATLVCKVREPPNISKSYGVAEAGEDEIGLVTPVTPRLVFVTLKGKSNLQNGKPQLISLFCCCYG